MATAVVRSLRDRKLNVVALSVRLHRDGERPASAGLSNRQRTAIGNPRPPGSRSGSQLEVRARYCLPLAKHSDIGARSAGYRVASLGDKLVNRLVNLRRYVSSCRVARGPLEP